MIAPSILEEYPERAQVEALTFLRNLKSRQLRRMAMPLIRAATIGEIGRPSLTALTAIDLVLVEQEPLTA